MSDTPKEGDLHTEAGLFLVMHEALAAEREWRARLERKNAELSDQVMRWFKAASPYATPGSLAEGLKRIGELCSAAGLETSEGPRQSAEPAVAAPTCLRGTRRDEKS